MSGLSSTVPTLYSPRVLDLRQYLVKVLPMPGLVFRVVVLAVGALHNDDVVTADTVAGLTHLDVELVVGALDQAVVEGLVEHGAGGYRPVVIEPVVIDVEAVERGQVGQEIDCTCGAAAAWPCLTARGRVTGNHASRRQYADHVLRTRHRQDQAA